MAYNVLKGTVEGSVDQHADQEIGGIKVFKNTISASVFYDTDAQSPCATMKDVAITEVKGGRPTSVLTYMGDKTAVANRNLLFDGDTLHVKNIAANTIGGDASGLVRVPSDRFIGPIGADFVNHGVGLQNVRNQLQVKVGNGMIVDDEGLSVSVGLCGAISINSNVLCVDPAKSDPINAQGQNLSDDDLLLVADTSLGDVRHTTLINFYENHIKTKIPTSAGSPGHIQLKANNGFVSTPKLSFDAAKSALVVEGTTSTVNLNIEKALNSNGAVSYNIKTTKDASYEVQASDYTILCNSFENPVSVILPPACNNKGRVIIVKKTNTDKYNLKSHPVTLMVSEGTIDLTDILTIKMNYSSRTVQSDGTNWWIIGTKGT